MWFHYDVGGAYVHFLSEDRISRYDEDEERIFGRFVCTLLSGVNDVT